LKNRDSGPERVFLTGISYGAKFWTGISPEFAT
jgi:hypothetical protein